MKNSIIEYVKGYGFKSVVVLRALKVFIILFVLTVMLITVAYNGIKISSQKTFLSENKAELKKVTVIFENFLREAEYLTAKTFSNSVVKYFFSMNDKQTLGEEQKEKLMLALDGQYNTGIKRIYLYNPENNIIFTSKGETSKAEIENSYWLEMLEDGFSDSYKIVFSKTQKNFVNSLFFIKRLPASAGFITVELDIGEIKSKFNELIGNGEMIFITINEDIIFSNTSYDIPDWFSDITGDEGYIKKYQYVYGRQASYYYKNLNYTVCSSGLYYMSGIRNIYMSFVFIFITVFVLIVIVSFATSKDSLYYISNLINIFETKKAPRKLKDNEIKYIGDKIIYLIDDNEKLKKDVEARITDYNEMQHKALQKQITPHFINNSLTVLGTEMIKNYGYDNSCVKMLTKLTRIIKYSYISENVFVSVGEEIAFLKDYMAFLKYRYKDFEYNIECNLETDNFRILKMTLQPFVENAVFYGIKDNGGCVSVKILKTDDRLEIIIYDNGNGISRETIQKIYSESLEDNFQNERIGIKNVFKRLKLVYGEDATIEIRSEIGVFTEFKISIPTEPSL